MRHEVVERRRAVVRRLIELDREGRLDTATVKLAASSLGVHYRSIWRWIAGGGYQAESRTRWQLTPEAVDAYYQSNGHPTIAWRLLKDAVTAVPSESVFLRAVRDGLSPAERAYARHGEDGRRRYELYRRYEVAARNDLWEMDHAQLDIEVLPLRGRRPVSPWLTVIIDSYSRLIMGWALSIRPSSAEVLASLLEGMVVDAERGPWGGVPDLVRFDGGKEFLAQAITQAAGEVGFAASPTTAYSPHLKGKVERLHQTIAAGLIATLPYYTGGPRKRNGQLYKQDRHLSLAELQAALVTFVGDYNTTHAHSSLGGLTPAEKWETSAAPLRLIPAEQLQWMLMADQTRKVHKDGVHFGGLIFIGPGLGRHVGATVHVRYMPHDLRHIELFTDAGKWICTATPQDALSKEEAEAVIEERQVAAREMANKKARAVRKARPRTAPLTGTTDVTDIRVISANESSKKRRALSDGRSDQLLKLLGLSDQLNKPDTSQDAERSDG
jgi:putative transposase